MSADGSVSFVWADREYKFRLAIGQMRELQDKTKVGPYALLRRVMANEWMIDDLREIIRLGLIGGGEVTPIEALSLVQRYVEARPWAESSVPAQVILAASLFGDPEDEVGKTEPEKNQSESGSTSPVFTVQEPQSGSHPM